NLARVYIRSRRRADYIIRVVPVCMIDKVESRGAELECVIRGKCEPFHHCDVVVLIPGVAERPMRSRSIAERKIGRLVEIGWTEPQGRARVVHVRIHARCHVYVQRLRHTTCVIELWTKIDRIAAQNHSRAADRPALDQAPPPVAETEQELVRTER